MDAATFAAIVDGVWAILRRSQPDCTREDVLDAFSVTEMMQVLEYINFRMRTRRAGGNGATPASAEPEEEQPTSAPTTAPAAATRKPKPSRSA